MKKNDVIRLSVRATARNGCGVANTDEGMTVFIRNACTGDVIDARIIKVAKSYAVAIIEALVQPSADRFAGGCPFASKCGGCAFDHITYEAESALKAQSINDAFERIGKLPLRLSEYHAASMTTHYRNKAVYPVAAGRDGQLISGFFAEGSHRIVTHDACLIGDKSFPAIRDAVLLFAAENGIKPYDEATGKGLLRSIYIRSSADGKAILTLILNGEAFGDAVTERSFIAYITGRFPALVSVYVNVNCRTHNAVLGGKWRVLYGDSHLYDELCGKRFRVSPASFWQVNHAQAEILYGIAKNYAALKEGETLLDLYCGTGSVGICIAEKNMKLTGVEIVEQAVVDASFNAKENGIDGTFICLDAGNALDDERLKGIHPDVITVDPPRAGCGIEASKKIASLGAKRIVYISCDPETLARDLAVFDACGYKAVIAEGVDMFPRTGHVETVVLMSRVKE